MKWVFLLFMIGLVPALAGWIKANPGKTPWVAISLGFIPYVQGPWNLYIAPISWAAWPGYVKGLEISLLDAVALAVLVSRFSKLGKLPFKFLWLAYIFAALLSVFQSQVPMASFFYVWQLLRMFLLFAAVVAICDDDRMPRAILTGLVAGLALQAFYSISESAGGALQAGGTFGHQNLLGLIAHFTIFPALALLLAGERGWPPKVGPLAGLITQILTASRATIGFSAIGVVVLMLLSSMRRWTSRKAMMVGLGCVALAVATPFALSSLNNRFESASTEGSNEEREAFERAAWLMSADYPMGVGANYYVLVANAQGYSERAGVIWNFGSRATNVHNTYLLMLAETGWLGVGLFMLLVATVAFTAFRCAWMHKKDIRGDLLLGLGVALVTVSIHCLYEWAFVTFHVQYMFAINAGLVAGVAKRLGYWGGGSKRMDARARPPARVRPRNRQVEPVPKIGPL